MPQYHHHFSLIDVKIQSPKCMDLHLSADECLVYVSRFDKHLIFIHFIYPIFSYYSIQDYAFPIYYYFFA